MNISIHKLVIFPGNLCDGSLLRTIHQVDPFERQKPVANCDRRIDLNFLLFRSY